jgi:hypothetical protein
MAELQDRITEVFAVNFANENAVYKLKISRSLTDIFWIQ